MMLLNEDAGRLALREAHLDVRTDARGLRRARWEEARRGLLAAPKELSTRWLFDERGILLFDELTHIPAYYPARRERSILASHVDDVARISRAQTLVELGRFGEPTRMLLDALRTAGTLRRFSPVDPDEAALQELLLRMAREYPGLNLSGVVGDFLDPAAAVGGDDRRLVTMLGGRLGNLPPGRRGQFLRDVADSLKVGDTFLVGADLLKDPARLNAAYNDREGVNAALHLNALHVLNRELGATFDVKGFEHEARFDEAQQAVEVVLRALHEQTVHIEALELRLHFDQGEALRTALCCKLSAEEVEDELAAAGLRLLEWWTDDAGDCALALCTRAGTHPRSP